MPLRCIDASVVVAWFVPSQWPASVVNACLAHAEGKDELVSPPLLYPETISAIRRLAARGILSPDEALGIVTDFLSLEIATPTPRGLYQRAYSLATRYGFSTAYDTCYLALAELLSYELLTLDQRLYNAASRDFPSITLVSR